MVTGPCNVGVFSCFRFKRWPGMSPQQGGSPPRAAPDRGPDGAQSFNCRRDPRNWLPSGREYTGFALLLLMILVLVPVYAFQYDESRTSSTQQGPTIGGLQLRSSSVDITGMNSNGPTLNLDAVVYNPYSFGAVLDGANYSVYADGMYLGGGEISHEYDFALRSSQTLSFPLGVGWKPAIQTVGNYMMNWGDIAWEVNGTAKVEIGGLPLLVSFGFAIG